MSSTTTTDPTDPRIKCGSADVTPVEQHEVYLVLSEEERSKGFVRPYRNSYVHVGLESPKNLRDLTDQEKERYSQFGYIKFEEYNNPESSVIGRYWTQSDLNLINNGCGTVTKMGQDISETYARDPHFYGSTYCVGCKKHRPVEEFVWDGTNDRVGS